MHFARTQSDETRLQNDTFSKSLLDDRRRKRQLKAQEKRLTKRQVLLDQQRQLAERQQQPTQQRSKVLLQQSSTVEVEGLPPQNAQEVLEELLKNYPGVEKICCDGEKAQVTFQSSDSAKFAVMGLNRFKVD